MLALKRRLYQLILRLHPAAFRNRFAREMSLDFEDALATYGFPRLLFDATGSLGRQWTAASISFTRTAPVAPISSHPLLAGQYLALEGDPLTPFELLRGTLLFAVLFFFIGLAFNAHPVHLVPLRQNLSAGHDVGLGAGIGNPSQPASESHAIARGPDYSQTLVIPTPYLASRYSPYARNGHTIYTNPAAPVRRVRTESWKEFLTRCALITAIVWLISFLLRRSRTILMRTMLIALGLLGVTLSAVASPLHVPPTYAQIIHSDSPPPTFEVATIKPPNPKVRLLLTPPGSENLVTQAGTAKTLIANAYGVRPARVIGGPSWIDDNSKIYVIEGKIPEDIFARMQNMTGDQRHDQACLMLQSLLAARFSLKVHIESREMPVYDLILAKSGAKLPLPNDEAPPDPAGSRVQQMSGGEIITKDGIRTRNLTLDGMLEPSWFDLGDRPVINKTGLTGRYDLTIHWLPDIAGQLSTNAEMNASESQASFFTALEEQFGLKLVSTRAPVDVIVIDAIQPPSEN